MLDSNYERATRGEQAIRLHPDLAGGGIGIETAAADIIADILHFGRLFGQFDVDYTYEQAMRTFHGDITEGDDTLPAEAK